MVGTCFFAFLIGAVGSLLADGDRVRVKSNEQIDQAYQFCISKNLPKDLTHAIITHTRYHCKNNFMFDEMSVLDNLPEYLQMDVSAYIGKQILKQIGIFSKHIDSYTMGLIALKMKSVSCNAGYKLFQTNDIGNKIYIQRSGKALLKYKSKALHRRNSASNLSNISNISNYSGSNVLSPNNTARGELGSAAGTPAPPLPTTTTTTAPAAGGQGGASTSLGTRSGGGGAGPPGVAANVDFEQELGRGDVCGQLALVYETRQYSVECLTWCEFYVIDIGDIWMVLSQEYPTSFSVLFFFVKVLLSICFFFCE